MVTYTCHEEGEDKCVHKVTKAIENISSVAAETEVEVNIAVNG